MKQLKRLLLIISCIFLLPMLQGKASFVSSSRSQITLEQRKAVLNVASHIDATDLYYLNSSPLKFRYRTKALNDYHELCLFVASIRIKSLFVYIHSRYKGFKESYISVAVTLSDWRGPPVA